ncbi:MAG TPA: response regulator [Candidatus Dormibacteraeota bacterium]|nr:response regulator [Candidatus Dormibacteraeota bacterium]
MEAIEAAAARRGRGAVARDRQAIEDMSALSLARLLRVDDHPDHNCYETVALERIGILVTVATSTEAARFYLQQLPFDLLITDLGRGAEPKAGRDLLRRVRATRPELPVIVYTWKAEPVRAGLLAEGAAAVVDLPGDLVVAVQAHRPRGPR